MKRSVVWVCVGWVCVGWGLVAACGSSGPARETAVQMEPDRMVCWPTEPGEVPNDESDLSELLMQPVPPCLDEEGEEREPASCGHYAYVVSREDDEGQHDLVVYHYAGGMAHYQRVLEHGSGGGCPWEVTQASQRFEGWSVIALRAELFDSEMQNCESMGVSNTFLFVEERSGRLAARVHCMADEATKVVLRDGRFSIDGCRGGLAPFAPGELHDCATP